MLTSSVDIYLDLNLGSSKVAAISKGCPFTKENLLFRDSRRACIIFMHASASFSDCVCNFRLSSDIRGITIEIQALVNDSSSVAS